MRLKKKKSPLVLLKTPACPSLLKLFSCEYFLVEFESATEVTSVYRGIVSLFLLIISFTAERRVEKVPSDVYVQLEPLTYGDASHIVSSQRNPYLKVHSEVLVC